MALQLSLEGFQANLGFDASSAYVLGGLSSDGRLALKYWTSI
jgi:hypothetical protein